MDVSNTCYIGNIFGVTSTGGVGVFVNEDGQLGTASSSRRFKKEIKPMDKASEAILCTEASDLPLQDGRQGTPQFGLIAEEVAKVNPELVVRDKEGKPTPCVTRR